MGLILLIILVLLIAGAAPVYPWNRTWGYYPVGGLGLVLVVLIVLALVGAIPLGW